MMPGFWLSPSLTQPHGRQVAMPWSTFASRVQSPRPGPSEKDGLARWAPTEFRNAYRCRAGVLRVHGVVLDVDDGSPLERIEAAFAGLMFVAHSTFSATAEHPRWRVVVPLDWPVNADQYDRAWRCMASGLEAEGATPDYSARDASRAWAVPARPPSRFYVTAMGEGAFASTDDALAAIPEQEPLPQPTEPRTCSYENRCARARRYLEKMPGALAGSHGHATTFRAALAMTRGFGLDPDDALAVLVEVHNPICQPAWSLPELRHKVKQAYQRARLPFGWLAMRRRDGRAA